MSSDWFCAIRKGWTSPHWVQTWPECQLATAGFSRPVFRKMPREHVDRCLPFEREEEASNFADQACAPVKRGKGKGKGRGREGGAPDPTGGRGRGGGGQMPIAAAHPPVTQPPMPNFQMGNHPPIPPTGMPPAHQIAKSAPAVFPGACPSSNNHPSPGERACSGTRHVPVRPSITPSANTRQLYGGGMESRLGTPRTPGKTLCGRTTAKQG
jgi:hypothetical protein